MTNQEPGRNDACPCGSGKKYKKCCFLTKPKGGQARRASLFNRVTKSTATSSLAGRAFSVIKEQKPEEFAAATEDFAPAHAETHHEKTVAKSQGELPAVAPKVTEAEIAKVDEVGTKKKMPSVFKAATEDFRVK